MHRRFHRWVDYSLILGPIIGLGIVVGLGVIWYFSATYDLVISGGRLVNPSTGVVEVMHVGINNGKIVELSEFPLLGRTEIKAKGHIVGPGFIDSSAHIASRFDQEMALRSGVTTVIDFAVGETDITAARYRVKTPYLNIGQGVDTLGIKPSSVLTPDQYSTWIYALMRQVRLGGGAIIWTVPSELNDASSELLPLLAVAAQAHVPLSINLPIMDTRGDALAMVEMILKAAESVSANVVFQNVLKSTHVYSRNVVSRIHRVDGAIVGVGINPYLGEIIKTRRTPFPLDELKADSIPVFDLETGRPVRFDRGDHWPSTALALITSKSLMESLLMDPHSLVGSESHLLKSETHHPRNTGTFDYILDHWVVEKKELSWADAFELLSARPAHFFEWVYPDLKNKGRLEVGADADIVILDPQRLDNWGTYHDPVQPSRAVKDVIVNGQWVIRNRELVKGAAPGKWLNSGAISK
jgi:hypothetical protein